MAQLNLQRLNWPDRRRTLTILQHNVLHWTKKRRYGLANAYLLAAPDVILLNAHGNTDEERINILGFVFYQQNRSGRRHDGVAIGVRLGLPHKIQRDFTSETMAVTLETVHGELTLATSYLPPSRPYVPVNDFDRLAATPHPMYLMGDLNAHHRIFGYADQNTVGRQLEELIDEGQWTHLGPAFKTYHCYRSMTTPDLVLGNQHAYLNYNIVPGPSTTSDHVPVLMTVSVNPLVVRTEPTFSYKDADWEVFKRKVEEDLALPDLDGQPVASIDEAVERFYQVVEAAKEEGIPKKVFRVLQHPQRSPELHRLEHELRLLREEAELTYWDRLKYAEQKRLQRNLLQEGERLRGEKWQELLTKIAEDRGDAKKFWASVKRLRGCDSTPSDHLVDSEHPRRVRISDPEGREALMRRHWQPVFRISAQENADFDPQFEARVEQGLQERQELITPHLNVDLARLDDDVLETAPFTAGDVLRIVKSFRNRRAPGCSGVRKEDLANLPGVGYEYLAQVFSACLSSGYFPMKFKHARVTFIPKSGKSPTNPLNYRPISLLETPGKILEKLVNERVQEYAETNAVHDPQQYGFRQRRGTAKVIALAYENVANAVALGGSANIIMRDIEKAFDKVWHAGLKFRLTEIGLPPLLVKICGHFLDGRTAAIRERGFTGPAFPLLSGVPQGSCLSPTLFILYTSDTPPPDPVARTTHLAYADDHNQLVFHQFRGKRALAATTGRAAEARNQYERERKIKNQLAKMKVIAPRRRGPSPLTIDGVQMRYSHAGNLLGLRLNLWGIAPQVKHIAGKARRNLSKLRRFSSLPTSCKLRLYKALIRPILEYPAVALITISDSAMLNLQRVQSNALLWVHGGWSNNRRPTNRALHARFRMAPVNVRLHRLARRTWERLEEDEDPNLQDVVRMGEAIGDAEHRWWPRSRPRALRPPPRPCYVREDFFA